MAAVEGQGEAGVREETAMAARLKRPGWLFAVFVFTVGGVIAAVLLAKRFGPDSLFELGLLAGCLVVFLVGLWLTQALPEAREEE
jgi:hypothetical protein